MLKNVRGQVESREPVWTGSTMGIPDSGAKVESKGTRSGDGVKTGAKSGERKPGREAVAVIQTKR